MNTIRLYGIRNCDTVQRARQWLTAHAATYEFHDLAKAGVPVDRLQGWVQALGWQAVLNRKGSTWRKLDETTRAGVVDAVTSVAVLRLNPSLIKRPVVEWLDGRCSLGFDADDWLNRIGIET